MGICREKTLDFVTIASSHRSNLAEIQNKKSLSRLTFEVQKFIEISMTMYSTEHRFIELVAKRNFSLGKISIKKNFACHRIHIHCIHLFLMMLDESFMVIFSNRYTGGEDDEYTFNGSKGKKYYSILVYSMMLIQTESFTVTHNVALTLDFCLDTLSARHQAKIILYSLLFMLKDPNRWYADFHH